MLVDVPAPTLRSSPALGGGGPLVDRFGRTARDLRVSLTDRCNLRCTYCMPAEGLAWLPDERLLTNAELVRLVDLAVRRLGITTVRLTGGEPLLRPDLEALVAAIAGLRPRPTIALTTNGIGLSTRAAGLRDAGLDRINVSLDTLSSDTFHRLSRRRQHAAVLRGLRAARDAGLDPVKVNAVLMRGVNDHEAIDLVRFAREENLQLRFIEQMPLDAQRAWTRAAMVTADEIRTALARHVDLVPVKAEGSPRGSAPAELFRVRWPDGDDRQLLGIIASVTRPFCGACDRVRLTADGQVRSCLFSRTETDLRGALRSGADEDALIALWRGEMAAKQPGHGIADPSFLQPERPMSAIGG